MKFARKAGVFRGQLDAAPFATVAFLLILFLLLNTSLVFVPAVRLDPDQPADFGADSLVVRYRTDGRVEMRGETIAEAAFPARLRQLAATQAIPSRLVVVTDATLTATNLAPLRALARELRLTVETPSSPIDLPTVGETPGVAGPQLAVAVNASGQLFHDNRLVAEAELKAILQRAVGAAGGPLTLLILADGGVPHETVMRLVGLGREAGVRHFVQGVRPAVFGSPRPPSRESGGAR